MKNSLTATGRWLALGAAILGWMFDGLEMGLFPLAARPAIREILFEDSAPSKSPDSAGEQAARAPVAVTPEVKASREKLVATWYAVMTANFLIGAATGGVLFGWLGDRLGRVRAMALSVLTYAIFSGLCGTVSTVQELFLWRFIASLGMGGEWALGVSLVMELWPSQSRGWLAGLIGAASNVGFVLIACVSIGIKDNMQNISSVLISVGLPEGFTSTLMANEGWRFLMICGAFPALLTFFIRVFVPESERWLEEQGKGTTSHWATQDLLGVLFGSLGPLAMIYLWAIDDLAWLGIPADYNWPVRWITFIPCLGIAIAGYLYPVRRYLARARAAGEPELKAIGGRPIVGTMLLGAALSGVALMGTWGSLQWAPVWVGKMTEGLTDPALKDQAKIAKELVQIVTGFGAICGTIGAALIGHLFGRRITYAGLCVLSLLSVVAMYRLNDTFGFQLLFFAFLAGGITAAFYGWLPLYLPELFPTRVRATGQGFSFNFGRILAAAGALQQIALSNLFQGDYAQAGSVMSLIYLVGLMIIWLAPETRGKELLE